jgi:hypothetical protein
MPARDRGRRAAGCRSAERAEATLSQRAPDADRCRSRAGQARGAGDAARLLARLAELAAALILPFEATAGKRPKTSSSRTQSFSSCCYPMLGPLYARNLTTRSRPNGHEQRPRRLVASCDINDAYGRFAYPRNHSDADTSRRRAVRQVSRAAASTAARLLHLAVSDHGEHGAQRARSDKAARRCTCAATPSGARRRA